MKRLPVLFVSHGAPDFAIKPGEIGPKLRALGRKLPRPRAIVVVSPHWETRQPRVTAVQQPETIHDFGGFDPALHDIRYPAPGDSALAERIARRLRQNGWPQSEVDPERGLDHGAWVPLLYLYPKADIPVLQVSLPHPMDGDQAYRYGEALASLTEEGVLVIGSGSLTHNLYEVFQGGRDTAYAVEFSEWIRHAATQGDSKALRSALQRAPHARRAHPTPEHYWPLLVAAGAARGRPATHLEGGMTYKVLAMDAFVFD